MSIFTPTPASLRAAALMKSHHVRISQAIARQLVRLVPRYRQVDQTALERNLSSLLGGVEVLLEKGEDQRLMQLIEDVALLRQSSGFTLQDFVMAGMSFLPVLRRFFMERCSITEGLEAYEAVETVALPVLGRAASLYLDVGEDTEPMGRPAFLGKGKRPPFEPMLIESVTGDESTERLPLGRIPR
ncbi:MAG: hypothetical protein AB2A00_19065 [Myxococcota bacterium]